MLDPRIYRMGIVPVVLAVIVLAFSLEDQPGALSTNVVPDAFNGTHAYATMGTLAASYPRRAPGSNGDRRLAGYIAGQLRRYGYNVSADTFRGTTAPRTADAAKRHRAPGGRGKRQHRDRL
jgi:hypothetical protein